MEKEYVLLTEKEEMWAGMLMQVLEDNGIACTGIPVYGAGLAIRTGARERLRIFVPEGSLPRAAELLEELFSAEPLPEDGEGTT